MSTSGWESIEQRKRQLLQETSDLLEQEEFDILEATLKIESRYRHQARLPKAKIIAEISRFVERKIRDASEED